MMKGTLTTMTMYRFFDQGDAPAISDLWDGERLRLPAPSEPMLRRLFGLTPAEARLAQALSRGDGLAEIAQALAIKMPTARSQLAAIFGKTQTNRQPQLVALLVRLAHLEPVGQGHRFPRVAENEGHLGCARAERCPTLDLVAA